MLAFPRSMSRSLAPAWRRLSSLRIRARLLPQLLQCHHHRHHHPLHQHHHHHQQSKVKALPLPTQRHLISTRPPIPWEAASHLRPPRSAHSPQRPPPVLPPPLPIGSLPLVLLTLLLLHLHQHRQAPILLTAAIILMPHHPHHQRQQRQRENPQKKQMPVVRRRAQRSVLASLGSLRICGRLDPRPRTD